jgi:1-deoxy-D-xylulose-5-phosphate reductoisomerase
MKRKIALLGATGSIGDSTLDVIARHPDRFEVFALSGAQRVEKLAQLVRTHRPKVVAVADAKKAEELRALLGGSLNFELLIGTHGLDQIAALPEVDTVVAAIVGAAGLSSTLAAAQHGKRILLANKEALVMGGPLVRSAVERSGAVLLPVDSEHNALFQCIPYGASANLTAKGIERLWLTASGGPFRTRDPSTLVNVTPDEACAHPNWVMGRKISVDSATMMNKGLEVIEARWLFDCPVQRISVVLHPQSVVHSMVQYVDGSFLAQLGSPDMRTPIANALAYPDRIAAGVQSLDPLRMKELSFTPPDEARFPCLRLAYQALTQSHGACIVLNAANEVAVDAFLRGKIRFTEIAAIVEHCLNLQYAPAVSSFDETTALDAQARSWAVAQVERFQLTLA